MKIGNIEIYGVIYKIKNNINNKIYIGQTVDGFDKRYKNNLYKYTHNSHLKNSIDKYGIKNFEITKELDIAFSEDELNIKEQTWISFYKTNDIAFGYNKTLGGDKNKFSEETRRKLSKSAKKRWENLEYKKRLTNSLKKITSSEKYREKMSLSLKNSAIHKESVSSNSFREKQSSNKKELWKNKSYREKNTNAVKLSWTEDRKQKASLEMKNRYKDEEYLKNISNSFRKRWNDEIQKEKMCNSMKKKFLAINTETKEVIEFLGRKELADYFGISESYIKTFIYKKKLYKNKFLLIRKDLYKDF